MTFVAVPLLLSLYMTLILLFSNFQDFVRICIYNVFFYTLSRNEKQDRELHILKLLPWMFSWHKHSLYLKDYEYPQITLINLYILYSLIP